jgi:hypothetical protein
MDKSGANQFPESGRPQLGAAGAFEQKLTVLFGKFTSKTCHFSILVEQLGTYV